MALVLGSFCQECYQSLMNLYRSKHAGKPPTGKNLTWLRLYIAYRLYEQFTWPVYLKMDAVKQMKNTLFPGESFQTEARLVFRFDSLDAVPWILQQCQIYVISVDNRTVALVSHSLSRLYPVLKDTPGVKTLTIPPTIQHSVALQTITQDGESLRLALAYESKMFHAFCNRQRFIQGHNERVRFPKKPLAWRCGPVDMVQQGAQLQWDMMLETEREIYLIEAKMDVTRSTFNIRQLLYPALFWNNFFAQYGIEKTIHTIFFTYKRATNVYTLRQFEFNDMTDITSWHVTKSASYTLQ